MKGKTIYLAVALILFFGVLFNLPAPASRQIKGLVRDAMAPYQALTTAIGSGIRQRTERWRQRREAAQRVVEMDSEVHALQRELLLLQDVRDQNAVLRRQLAYAERAPGRLIPCRVIARGEMTGWWRTLRVNRGDSAGMTPDMAVVSERGLIGRIIETSRYTSEILLISDASSRVSVRVLPSGTVGILEGVKPQLKRRDLPDLLLPLTSFQVDYLSVGEDVREGDQVVTSGLGGVFPSGLPVGRVTAVRLDASGLYRRAEIQTMADLARLDTVYGVLVNRGMTP